jgi:hypothetical protein
MGSNKREQERLSTRNFLDYVVLADDGTPVARGLGRTLNVSSGGLLMETADRVDLGRTLLVTLGLGEEMVEISGRVTRSAPSTAELYATGIEFAPVDRARQTLLDRYLQTFQASQGHV